MNNLLINEYPLIVLPSLACKIGLNEALITQQIHYWTEINRKTGRHFIEERYWVYNTVAKWEKQFPFWSKNTIIRSLDKLRKEKIVEAKILATDPRDRTLWYSINYQTLEDLSLETTNLFTQNENIQDLPKLSGHINPTWVNEYKESETTTEITTESTKAIAPKTDFDLFREAYNEHKPGRWPTIKTVNESRKRIFLGWVKEHGGLNEAIAVLIDALKFARSDPWWNDKDITIENFAAKGRMTQFHERYMNQSRGVPSAPQQIPTLPEVSEAARNKLRSYQ